MEQYIDNKHLIDVFKPQLLEQYLQIAFSKLEQYLSDSSIRGLALTNPHDLLNQTKQLMAEPVSDDISINKKLSKIIELYIKTGIQVHSTGYMGRQFSGVVPLAGVMDFVSSIVNQPSSFYEAAQLPNVVEQLMAEEFNQFIGWEKNQFAMITTSGGSLGNLTALLAARNDKFPHIWSEGISALQGLRPAIAMGEDVHYGITRAAGILGIGEKQIVRLPLNEKKQIDVEKVRPLLEKAEQQGLYVFCIVASAGTTSTGAFDPIDELADIAIERNLWFHVDGAHGASLLVSDEQRHKLKGIEKVDSFVLDGHKMLFIPAMCTLLFYKNKEKSYGAFQQQASYVFEKTPDIYSHFESAEQNFECTKRPLIMNLWLVWTLYGRSIFADKINYLCHLTQEVYQLIDKENDFITLHKPECNILCFRYLPSNLDEQAVSDFQLTIRNRLREEGRFFISKVDIDHQPALRVVFMNHLITIEHVKLLLDEIRTIGQALLSQ